MVESPALAAPLAAPVDGRMAAARHAFSAPERIPLIADERAALTGAAEPPLRHEGIKLARWTLGTGPRVVLVHGWNSRGAHLLGFAKALVEAGFSVTSSTCQAMAIRAVMPPASCTRAARCAR